MILFYLPLGNVTAISARFYVSRQSVGRDYHTIVASCQEPKDASAYFIAQRFDTAIPENKLADSRVIAAEVVVDGFFWTQRQRVARPRIAAAAPHAGVGIIKGSIQAGP